MVVRYRNRKNGTQPASYTIFKSVRLKFNDKENKYIAISPLLDLYQQ
jgi:hypothetical protein